MAYRLHCISHLQLAIPPSSLKLDKCVLVPIAKDPNLILETNLPRPGAFWRDFSADDERRDHVDFFRRHAGGQGIRLKSKPLPSGNIGHTPIFLKTSICSFFVHLRVRLVVSGKHIPSFQVGGVEQTGETTRSLPTAMTFCWKKEKTD